MSEPIQLDVWKGDWGLPSVDINCLNVLAYAKFSGVPLKLKHTSNPFRTPNGVLPVLRCENETLDSIKDIIGFFRKKNYSADFELTPKQCAEVVAYETMLKEKIYPAMQYVWWVDIKNYNEFIRPWYAKALPFPLNFYYPGKYERQAQAMMESLYPTENEISVIESGVYSEAQKCLTLLSTRLGENEYFFGSYPTSLDAIIYSYLAPLLKAPLPNPALQNHLKACTNLVKFVSRITQRYFGDICQEYERIKAEENSRKLRRDSESEFPHKRRNQFFAGIFATLAMLGYAFSTGIVEIPNRMNFWSRLLGLPRNTGRNMKMLWSLDKFVSNEDKWSFVFETNAKTADRNKISYLLKVTIKDDQMLEGPPDYILEEHDRDE